MLFGDSNSFVLGPNDQVTPAEVQPKPVVVQPTVVPAIVSTEDVGLATVDESWTYSREELKTEFNTTPERVSVNWPSAGAGLAPAAAYTSHCPPNTLAQVITAVVVSLAFFTMASVRTPCVRPKPLFAGHAFHVRGAAPPS